MENEELPSCLNKAYSQAVGLAIEMYDFRDSDWRVKYPDGDWMELFLSRANPG